MGTSATPPLGYSALLLVPAVGAQVLRGEQSHGKPMPGLSSRPQKCAAPLASMAAVHSMLWKKHWNWERTTIVTEGACGIRRVVQHSSTTAISKAVWPDHSDNHTGVHGRLRCFIAEKHTSSMAPRCRIRRREESIPSFKRDWQ